MDTSANVMSPGLNDPLPIDSSQDASALDWDKLKVW